MQNSVDFLFLVPLEEVRDALFAQVSHLRRLPLDERGARLYYQAEVALPVEVSGVSRGAYQIIITSPSGMSRTESVTATTDAIQRWQPRYVILVGIASGDPAEVLLGDVLVAEQFVEYAPQDVSDSGELSGYQTYRADPRLMTIAQHLRNWEVDVRVPHPEEHKPRRHSGVISSEGKVQAKKGALALYKMIWPKLIGVEIEADGIAAAAWKAPSKPGVITVLGVADLIGAKKDRTRTQKWRPYACHVSAVYAVALLKSGLVPLIASSANSESTKFGIVDFSSESQHADSVTSDSGADSAVADNRTLGLDLGSQAAVSTTPPLPDLPRPPAPERYGQYALLERIGIGSMAEVWRAKTLGHDGFSKDLVIKRLLPKFTTEEGFLRSLSDEVHLLAKLQHPNITQIFDFGKEDNSYYFAMELVEGRDLRQAEKASARAGVWFLIPLSIYLISEALKGLHYAHTRRHHGKMLEIIHRDISPHNILISYTGDVKLSDFCITKLAERTSNASSSAINGKFAYMSPEQITGQRIDGRTDIFSMGIVFWELLTRHRLYFGPDEQDVIRRVRGGIVPSPRQYNAQISEELEKIVMKMLAANRVHRYQTAGEVARQLCALPEYVYEAQALGEYISTLFPEKTRNWTGVLNDMLIAKLTNGSQRNSAPAPAPTNSIEAATSITRLPPASEQSGPIMASPMILEEAKPLTTEPRELLHADPSGSSSHSAHQVARPTRDSLRKLLVEALRLDSELEAFCLDYFPMTERLFTAGMDAEQKRNILLRREEPAEILMRLREAQPSICERQMHLLRFEL